VGEGNTPVLSSDSLNTEALQMCGGCEGSKASDSELSFVSSALPSSQPHLRSRRHSAAVLISSTFAFHHSTASSHHTTTTTAVFSTSLPFV
jgi:hypothetical protein